MCLQERNVYLMELIFFHFFSVFAPWNLKVEKQSEQLRFYWMRSEHLLSGLSGFICLSEGETNLLRGDNKFILPKSYGNQEKALSDTQSESWHFPTHKKHTKKPRRENFYGNLFISQRNESWLKFEIQLLRFLQPAFFRTRFRVIYFRHKWF